MLEDEALSAYQAAARRDPSTTTWLPLGETADRMGHVDVAIRSLERAYGPWHQYASLGLKVGVAYTKAIAADPTFSWPYHNIGRLNMSQDNDAEALTWLTRALSVNPNHLRAQFNRAVAAARLGRYDDALAAYSRVLRVDPTDAEAHKSIGWLLLKSGSRDEGLRELQTAVRLEPSLDEERRYLDTQFGRDARKSPSTPRS